MASHRGNLHFELTRVLQAPAPVVFAVFSESAEMEKWWGPAGFSIPSIHFDARVGERYRIDPDDVETLVELSFIERGDSTEVTLVQGGFQTEARLALHEGGWTDGFGKVERLLSR